MKHFGWDLLISHLTILVSKKINPNWYGYKKIIFSLYSVAPYYHIISDCKSTTQGREYSGTLSTTKSGLTCQNWNLQSPHPHSMTDANRFPDFDLDSAGNSCRNPNSDKNGPWCYTTDEFVEWDYCDIAECNGILIIFHFLELLLLLLILMGNPLDIWGMGIQPLIKKKRHNRIL